MTEQNADRELLERELLSSPVGSLQYMLRQLAQVYPFLPDHHGSWWWTGSLASGLWSR